MKRIESHPILDVSKHSATTFLYDGHEVVGENGFTIAAALHQAGFPVHSTSLKHRNRSLECGIGKCGACEMLVDGHIKRICITNVDGVKTVEKIPENYTPEVNLEMDRPTVKIYKTDVVIIGAGPAGLAVRETLKKNGVSTIVVDNNSQIGGQFLMQTHQFFFFEKEKKFGGLRGFDIAEKLAGDDDGILLDSTVWDILDGKRVAVKNIKTEDVFFIDADTLVVATGAVPFMHPFENDDLPGVYTAAVIQKMMNTEFTLLGKNILTIGAGNIGYLTSYQLTQAGANVKAIIEARDVEGGFPVQANRLRRLGVPIVLSHTLVQAVPNEAGDGICGAIVAECENFKPIPGTEKLIEGIDAINICTGLVQDDRLLTKGQEVFGRNCFGAGDAIRIGEGTSAVLRGTQVAYEILDLLGKKYDYNEFLNVSKEYVDSQQHPEKVLEEAVTPSVERRQKPFVIIDCIYGFACNPCAFVCPFGAITKSSTSSVPHLDYDKCVGCMKCVNQCPGLAIFGYDISKEIVYLPSEHLIADDAEVFLVDNDGQKIGSGKIVGIQKKPNKTNILKIKFSELDDSQILKIRGAIVKEAFHDKFEMKKLDEKVEAVKYICHCDDVTFDEVLEVIGNRNFISIDEIKHTTRLGMGACRGKRCIMRLKPLLADRGIQMVGTPTPRAPSSNQLTMKNLYLKNAINKVDVTFANSITKKIETEILVAGGGIGGSSLFRYFAEAGLKPLMINSERGSSWRNIAGGRPSFSLPELCDIAFENKKIFEELDKVRGIDYREINYITFAHDQEIYRALEASREWSDAYMIEPKDFSKVISPHINPNMKEYHAALVTRNCWQATPGKVVDVIRTIGLEAGGEIIEDCKLISVEKTQDGYLAILRNHLGEYIECKTQHFINALGAQAAKFADCLDIQTGIYPVKHQAFITRRLPMLGVDNNPLGMVIDRRNYKGFVAVYGQQLAETGQIIGCASPAIEPLQTAKDLKTNDRDFMEIVSEVFVNWVPALSSVDFQAVWSGYYVEPKMIVDPAHGLFIGLRGQGFMLGQYLAKLYVDSHLGRSTPDYFERLSLNGDGLLEKAFK